MHVAHVELKFGQYDTSDNKCDTSWDFLRNSWFEWNNRTIFTRLKSTRVTNNYDSNGFESHNHSHDVFKPLVKIRVNEAFDISMNKKEV